MTVDYTKLTTQKTSQSLKASEIQTAAIISNPTKPHGLDERICTRCYHIGKPRIIEQGSWLGYVLPIFFDTPITLHGCRECNYPSSMVPFDSHEGKQAMYWHLKQNEPKTGSGDTQF